MYMLVLDATINLIISSVLQYLEENKLIVAFRSRGCDLYSGQGSQVYRNICIYVG